jgi:hypothetical protein
MQELYNYISLSRQHAQTDEQIKQALLEKGWSLEDINAALEDSTLSKLPGLSNQGKIIHGGFRPLPVSEFTNPNNTFSPPSELSPNDTTLDNKALYSEQSSLKRYLLLLIPLTTVFLIAIVACVFILGKIKNSPTVKLNSVAAKSSRSPSSAQPQTSTTTSPQPSDTSSSPSSSTSSSSSAIQPNPSPPTMLNLSNQDNSTTINTTVGTILNIQLAQLPNVTGYQWVNLAISTSTQQLGSDGIPTTQGSDGSISESNKIVAPGNFTIGLADNPDCSPGCNQQSLTLWEVNVNVL